MRHPNVPEALDGWHILHRTFRFDRRGFGRLGAAERDTIAAEATAALGLLAEAQDGDCGCAQLLGHKGDLQLTHYARGLDALGDAQLRVDRLGLAAYLEPRASYVSVLELGMYEATAAIHGTLATRGLAPQSPEWVAAFDALVADEAAMPRNAARLFAPLPRRRYACFYPMNKKRGDSANWYALPYETRARLMRDHGSIGRTYRGLVTQVISGSIGFDDWEWGVDLYADDPLVFKRLVYEMRFDAASAAYGEFGPFTIGLQFSVSELGTFLAGASVPQLRDGAPVRSCSPTRG